MFSDLFGIEWVTNINSKFVYFKIGTRGTWVRQNKLYDNCNLRAKLRRDVGTLVESTTKKYVIQKIFNRNCN